jgi:phage host-nuclease inhibitor protein Gam
MSKKAKFIPCLITSREAMDMVVTEVINIKLEIEKQKAAMEQEVLEVQAKHQVKINELAAQLPAKEAGVQIYCQRNREVLFPLKKSLDMPVGEVGFELNPFKVEKRRSKETWDEVVTRMLTLDWGKDYVREADPEVDKQALITDRKKLTDEQLKEAGIDIVQEEQFFIRPKSKVVEATVIKAAA